ncbi:MAG: hypothetical protein EU530_00665 [Promethearchaeota archaeon]|nr:MAG: hypothetical protein EU530_00665 [Candidatus Lokiarchaeota archaeon]
MSSSSFSIFILSSSTLSLFSCNSSFSSPITLVLRGAESILSCHIVVKSFLLDIFFLTYLICLINIGMHYLKKFPLLLKLMNSSFDIIFMGHFARDTIISPDGTISSSLGGGVTFGTLTAHIYNNNHKIGIFSEKGKDFNNSWLEIFDSEIDITGLCSNSDYSTNFEIEYFPKGGRKLTLKSKAAPLLFENLPAHYLNSKSFMISSIANEINFDFIRQLVDNTEGWISIDIQGFIRNFQQDGTINLAPIAHIIEKTHQIIKYCGKRLILKGSGNEINYIANCNDVIESTRKIAKLGNFIVCTTLGAQGSLVKQSDNKMIHVPAFIPDRGIIDETGAGDCYISAFLSEFIESHHHWNDLARCANIGSSAASFLLEHKGPYGFGTKKQIQKRIEKGKIIPSHFENTVNNNNF